MPRWVVLVAYVAAIMVTLPWGPRIGRSALATGTGWWIFGPGLAIGGAIAVGVVARRLVRRGAPRWAWASLGAATLGGALGLAWLQAARLERIHLLEYAVVTWLAWRAIDPDGRRGRHGYALALLLAVAIGWGEELIQRFVPGRVYDLRDVAANALGALLGLLVLVALRAGEAPAPPALNAGS